MTLATLCWGPGTNAGNAMSGMFHPTGLPLPQRRNLDIYAEYWDQSHFQLLGNKTTSQVRISQGPGIYNSSTFPNKTDWYDVAAVGYIGSPNQVEETTVVSGFTSTTTSEEIQGADQLVRISLEKTIGNDANFCLPTDSLDLAKGLALEAKTTIIRDKSQFEGRFFVKIHRDSIIDNNIIAVNATVEEQYIVSQSRDVKYICAAHPGVQDWARRVPNISNTTNVPFNAASAITYHTNYITPFPDGSPDIAVGGGTPGQISVSAAIGCGNLLPDAATQQIQNTYK